MVAGGGDHGGERRPPRGAKALEARDLELGGDALVGHGLEDEPAVRRHGARGALSRSARRASPGRSGPELGRIGVEPQNQLGRPLRDGARDPIAEAECYLTAFFRAAPAENFGTRVAAMWILSPVAGLRPSRALRLKR